MTHEIEAEILKATGMAPREYKDRQDYLCALLEAAYNLDQDAYDNVSDAVAKWCTESAIARKARKPLPEFDGGEYEDHSEADPADLGNTVTEPGDLVVLQGSTSGTSASGGKKKLKKATKPKLTGEIDEFGIAIGTKHHKVVQRLTTGATMKDIKLEFGDSYYNLVKRMEKAGHHVEKNGLMIKITHKDKVKKEA